MPARSPVVMGLVALCLVAGCAGRPTPTPTPEPTPTSPPPSPVPRLLPTATPQPLSPVPSAKMPGVVVPAGAKLVTFTPAAEDGAAQAEYFIADLDADDARDWFRKHMVEAGWTQPEELDGALLFAHRTELSAQSARQGYRRSALLLFESQADGVSVVINAESGD